MWFIFKSFATRQMAKTAKSEGRQISYLTVSVP